MYTVYGIPNCDSVKKALQWLEANGQAFTFHDFKKKGINAKKLERWINQQGLQKIMNAKSATWRQLSPEEQEKAQHIPDAITLLTQKTSLIKRPVIEQRGKVLALGFSAPLFETLFAAPKKK